MDLLCRKFTEEITNLAGSERNFSEKIGGGNASRAVLLGKNLRKETDELLNWAKDPFETVLRGEIAKKLGLNYIEAFSDGVAWASVRKGETSKSFVVNRQGEKISPVFGYIESNSPFRDGKAWVVSKEGKSRRARLVSTTGTVLLDLQANRFELTGYKESGLIVQYNTLANGETGEFIDTGDTKPFPGYVANSVFQEGLAWVSEKRYNPLDYVASHDGRIVSKAFSFPQKGTWFEAFSSGYSWVGYSDYLNLVEQSGKLLFTKTTKEWREVWRFRGDRARIQKPDGSFWFINPKGEEVAGPFADAGDFCGDRAWARASYQGKGWPCHYFLIDRDGNEMSRYFSKIDNFHNGTFIALDDRRNQFCPIDKNGQMIGENYYRNFIVASTTGLAQMETIDGRTVFVNYWGKEVFEVPK